MTIQNLLKKTAAHALLLAAITSSGFGQKRWDAPRVVTAYCSGCHGIDGNTQLPYFPKLAGLNATYAEKKMLEFNSTSPPPVDEWYWWIVKVTRAKKTASNLTRTEQIDMEGVAHAARTADLKAAVLWYAKQPAASGHSSNKALIEEGREFFAKGMPAQKILPCMTCHGPDGKGNGPVPRVAGQNAEYIESQLDKFRRGDRKHAPEMTMVTRDLDPAQARAVADYLQSR